MSTRKLLCLHGYTQNAAVFSKKIAVIRKQLKSRGLECVFVDAPHKANESFTDNPELDERAWWNRSDSKEKYVGLEESIEYLTKVSKEQGPFDGILGFSQGAVMTTIAASCLEIKPKFIIVISGFLPAFDIAKSYINYNQNSLHIMGQSDTLVSVERSTELAKLMEESGSVTMYTHDGGHVVPSQAAHRNMMYDWIESQEPSKSE